MGNGSEGRARDGKLVSSRQIAISASYVSSGTDWYREEESETAFFSFVRKAESFTYKSRRERQELMTSCALSAEGAVKSFGGLGERRRVSFEVFFSSSLLSVLSRLCRKLQERRVWLWEKGVCAEKK